MSTILERDSAVGLPSFTIVSASAGSGKTYTLTLRYIQLLLSPLIPHHGLKNIFAMTFTNNAAAEMRQRVLAMLKRVALGDPVAIAQVMEVVTLSEPALRARAREAVDEILDNFSDFQMRTIDSFIGQVFRASALELGFTPEFDVVMSNDELIEHAFDLYAKGIQPGSPAARDFLGLASVITGSAGSDRGYLWDPYAKIMAEVKKLLTRLSSRLEEIHVADHSAEIQQNLDRVRAICAQIQETVGRYGAKMDHYLQQDLADLASDDTWLKILSRTPRSKTVTVGTTKQEKENAKACKGETEPLLASLNDAIGRLAVAYARDYFRPYASALAMIAGTLENAKRTRGRLFIGDINKALVQQLKEESIPEIYFKLGDRIAHYLIDEFQDTSPIQWAALSVLIGNSLAEGGTLFVVGDTKQSIYGFRGADWQIMMNLMRGDDSFPPAPARTLCLEENRRSGENVVAYGKSVFHAIQDPETAAAARRSGLLDFEQRALPEMKGKGHVEVLRLQRDRENLPEREAILSLIGSALARGYSYGDIAILTPKNNDVIEVSGWLNDAQIPFISHSSLDIRIRRMTAEMIALLRFLDSPIDNLAFATFLLGTTFPAACAAHGRPVTHDELQQFIHRCRAPGRTPFYKAFQEEFPGHWQAYFDPLFTEVGYAPLYDLVVEACKRFDLFAVCPDEGYAIVKFLEVVKDFEEGGSNSVKDFLEFSGEDDDEGGWSLDPGESANAVRLMTVHKSKGLEFRVVIVLLTEYWPKGVSPLVYATDEGCELLHMNGDIVKRSADLEAIYAGRRLMDITDELNKLYVVLTRAREELYVIALSAKPDGKLPCSLLPPAAGTEPERPMADPMARHSEPVVAPVMHVLRKHASPVREEKIGFKETLRGDVLHGVLAKLEFVEGSIEESLDRCIAQSDIPESEHDEIRKVLAAFLRESGVLEFFERCPGRRALNEQDVVGRSGDLFRADRLVVDGDAVTVIDFKTGRDENEEQYLAQVRNYMDLAADVFNSRNVRGCIAYIDLKKISRL